MFLLKYNQEVMIMKIASIKVVGYIDVEIPDYISDTFEAKDWVDKHVSIEKMPIEDFDDYDLSCECVVDWSEMDE